MFYCHDSWFDASLCLVGYLLQVLHPAKKDLINARKNLNNQNRIAVQTLIEFFSQTLQGLDHTWKA